MTKKNKKVCLWCEWEMLDTSESGIVFNSDDGEILRLHMICLALLLKEYIENKKEIL